VQSSEATAHLLMTLAAAEGMQRAAMDEGVLDHALDQTLQRFPLFGVAHRITRDEISLAPDVAIPAGSVLCFSYPEFHRSGGYIPFGVAANRPCPAWHLAPVTVKAVTRELLGRYAFATTAAHTRALPNRAPCLMTPRDAEPSGRRLSLGYLWLRDRWENVGRSVVQLVLGSYMVWDARRQRLCQSYFERSPS
jgi:hypothetical protein